ncbi:hypothetical protein CCS41_08860 [Candidatus Fukatsuia symbiotica]|uniref:Uncharacterized protein n=1 Tax=Candidatus Fukatsuia symbiotica TaxID=1878942 RepID=A0A2U8I5Y2_9GAMM|nr:hypothetical protein [Candidatus Fukatsuia symbiotica]AWK14560.1 hypothetical protein CCS41_08860 [Candidatus Fukatsuia symbiotica]
MKKALASFLGIRVKKNKTVLVAESSTEGGYSNSVVESLPEAGSSGTAIVGENRTKFIAIFTEILLDPNSSAPRQRSSPACCLIAHKQRKWEDYFSSKSKALA